MKTDDELRPEPPSPRDKPALRHDRIMRAGQTSPPDRRITLLLAISLLLLIARSGGWSLLVVIVGLVVMIFLHELGHFITAKLSGMKVTEFFLGFGPKLWSFQRGETEYGVKALPAGAYVRIIGMNNLEEVPPEDEPRTYRAQSYPKRLMVAVAGSTMHFLQTLVCLFLLFTVTGSPGGHLFAQDHDYWRIDQVVDGSPAQQAGLQPHDRVTAVNGISIKTSEDFRGVIAAHPGEPLALDVERDGNHITLTATPEMSEGVSRIGVQISDLPEREKVGVLTATGRIFTDFGAGVRESISELGRFFSPSGLSDFASQVRHGGTPTVDTSNGTAPASGSPSADGNRPISIIGAAGIGADLTSQGFAGFLAFFATINLFIGIVNLAPLLPLDGGHVVIATYERLRSRRGHRYQVDVMKLLPLTYFVILLLGVLFVSTVFLDLVDPIRLN